MFIRHIALAAVTAAALAPAVCIATPQRASAESCARAFASSISAPGAAVRGYKLKYRGEFGGTLEDFYPTDFTFTMEARDPKSGAAIARAVCSTDSRGTVTGISAVPLDGKPSTPAAGL